MFRGRRSSGRRLGIAIVVAAVVLSACGSNKNETQKGADGSGSGKVVKIGVIAPLSGALTALRVGIRDGGDLAVRQANEAPKIKGRKLALAPEDDTATTDVGAHAATNPADAD